MIDKQQIHTLLAKKQAGINRMRDRQKRVYVRMAELIEDSPEVIDKAITRVIQRLENSGTATREIYTEWHQILTSWPVERIASLLRDDNPKTDQLRSSAPFDFTMREKLLEINVITLPSPSLFPLH